MKYNPNHHHRRSIRLKEYDYTTPNWYFITICVFDKLQFLFGKITNGKIILNEFGKIVEEEWFNTEKSRPNIVLDYYVIMPNHFHSIIIIDHRVELNSGKSNVVTLGDTARHIPIDKSNHLRRFGQPISNSLSSIIGSFKSACTKRINILRHTPGMKVWQSNYYEHIIRNEKDLYNTRNYIKMNPIKWEYDEYYK